jgi:hypothetical protein
MFEITEETRHNAIEAMREALGGGHTDDELNAAFDAAVAVVKAQFGF